MPIHEEYADGLAAINADVVADPTAYDTFVAVFARTYSHSEDPAAVVDCYHDFQRVRAQHPNAGSGKLATKLGVKRSNIRKWADEGAAPYVVQGLRTAEEREWIPMAFDSVTFRAINRLVAWVMSSGAIHGDRWSVQFVVDDDQAEERLEAALQMVDLQTVEPDEPGTQIEGTVLAPTPDGSILGRVLHSLGAPKGNDKQSSAVRLPPYLTIAPDAICRDWLRTYLKNRRRARDADNTWISFGEKRPREYRESFIQLVEDVTGGSASTSGTEIYVGTDATRELGLD